MNRERHLMARRNAELTREVEALRPKVADLELGKSLAEAALAATHEVCREREDEVLAALRSIYKIAAGDYSCAGDALNQIEREARDAIALLTKGRLD